MDDVCSLYNKTWVNVLPCTCQKQEAQSLALKVRRCEHGFNFTVLPCTAYEDTVLTRLVAPGLISSLGMMTRHLYKAGVYSRLGVYFTGENSIISQSTNGKVIFLLL